MLRVRRGAPAGHEFDHHDVHDDVVPRLHHGTARSTAQLLEQELGSRAAHGAEAGAGGGGLHGAGRPIIGPYRP